eukprot:gene14776-20825_t
MSVRIQAATNGSVKQSPWRTRSVQPFSLRMPAPLRVSPTQAVSDEPGPSTAFTPGMEGESRQRIFNNIASRYDELNNALSLGQHWVWKRKTVTLSKARPGNKVLDVCCGSGDLAFLLAKVVGRRGEVIGLDFAADMLVDADRRAAQQALPGLSDYSTPMEWVQGDAMELPYEADSFDAATMGYGLRNVSSIPKALQELHRVLKPGKTVAILDFNNSTNSTVDALQDFFLSNLVVPAAKVYNLEEEYKYLRPSIKAFPTGVQQEQLAFEAGFAQAKHYKVGFGLMGVLVATKKK